MQPSPGVQISDMGNEHIDSIDTPHSAYNTTPPTSGPHVGNIAKWGIHDEQIADEIQIHNLEDGGVIVHYDNERVSQEVISDLEDIVRNYSTLVILEPYSGLNTSIVLTAWNKIDELDDFDEERIKIFINAYKGIDHHN
ncbi:DUF3105 domain-containing protein [Candidatus Uhrbacteria bacterium]|nr:DUF3105 domain-containing protein [Candidatus Uhrbacteria bacterium]MBT7717018.1 DUF3105 domain-containing protein [Candidatus Uhrbacteria bacterium]